MDIRILAASGGSPAALDENELLVVLVQVAVLVGTARAVGALARRIGQPAVVGQILAGVLLGPSVLGALAPGVHGWIFPADGGVEATVFALSWLGIVFVLVGMGFETDLALINRYRTASLAVAAGSFLVPFAAATVLGLLMAPELAGPGASPGLFAAFVAVALSVSALPVVGKILSDLGLLRRTFGQLTIAVATIKDAGGWLILAVLTGLASEGIDLGSILLSFGGLALLVLVLATGGYRLLDRMFRLVLARGAGVTTALTITIVAALLGGAATQALGLEAILGAYLVGIVLANVRHQLPAAHEHLETVTEAFFGPVFFAFSGIRVDVTSLGSPSALGWIVAATSVAVVFKILGTRMAARRAGLDRREATALGVGLTPLGVMGVVVAIVGLDVGVFTDAGYSLVVIVAILTSLLAPTLVTRAAAGLEPSEDEARRLERETLSSDSEILGTTRILLPSRGGANSLYAASVAKAVFDGAEITTLAVEVPSRRRRGGDTGELGDLRPIFDLLGDGARRTRRKTADPVAAIVDESRLGYDLLVLGASGDSSDGGLVSTIVDRVLASVPIPTIVVRLPGVTAPFPPRRILVPVTASRSSRAAEELAYSLAREIGGSAVALHVVTSDPGNGLWLADRSLRDSMQTAIELVGASRAFGARLGADVDTSVKVSSQAEKEIVDVANSDGVDLLVLGAANRPLTERPFFGHRVRTIIENARIPVAIVALPTVRRP